MSDPIKLLEIKILKQEYVLYIVIIKNNNWANLLVFII